MQNNVVKALLLTLLPSILLCTLLFVIFCLPFPKREMIYLSDAVVGHEQELTEQNGVTYIGSGFSVTELTRTVERGEKAKITVSAENGTEIDIFVYYRSGLSKNDALVSKSVAGGKASWEWKIPSSSSSSSVRVVLRSNNTYATTDITII